MAIIRLATDQDMQPIKELWEECFTTDPAYLNLVFEKLYPLAVPFVFEDNGGILSSAFLLPIQYKNGENYLNGYYLYGVCTKKAVRGKGLAKNVIEYAVQYGENTNADFILTRPAVGPLFDYYRTLGFHTEIKRGMKTYSIPTASYGHHTNVPINQISDKKLFLLRERTFSDFFEWDEKILGIIQQTILLSGGAILAPDWASQEKYLAIEANSFDDSNMIISESNIENIEIHKEHIIRNAAGFTNSLQSLTLIFPLYWTDVKIDSVQEYALLKPLGETPGEIFKNAFFNFAME